MLNMNIRKNAVVLAAVLALGTLNACGAGSGSDSSSSGGTIELTNVSYDPTRELYAAYNEIFEQHYEESTGKKIKVTQSHGGSGKQALEVSNGLEADVVTLALEGDVQVVADAGLIDDGFVSEFPLDSSHHTPRGNPFGLMKSVLRKAGSPPSWAEMVAERRRCFVR